MKTEIEEAFEEHPASIAEILDRIIDQGIVIQGDIVISIADIDMIYIGLRVLVTSVDKLKDTFD